MGNPVTVQILMAVLTALIGLLIWLVRSRFEGLTKSLTTFTTDNHTAHVRLHESIDELKASVNKDLRNHGERLSSLESWRRNAKTQHVQTG